MDETLVACGADECVGPGMSMETESCQRLDELATEMAKIEAKSDVGSGKELNLRAEIDTSAPFESVKEAVCRFGGIGYWRPSNKLFEHEQHVVEESSIEKLEEQASQLENDLILKQRETLDILQELESTRAFVEDLKVKLRKEVSDLSNIKRPDGNTSPAVEDDDKENHGYPKSQCLNFVEGFKQAQRNLTRTTKGIAEIRASMEVFNKKLERERISLEKTRERLTQSSLKMSSVEERLNQTRQKLQVAKDSNIDDEHSTEILKELQILNFEAEKFKQMGEAAKSEILRTISKIERRKAKIRTAEIRLAAVAKMKEAARVAEAVALADVKVLTKHEVQVQSGESKPVQQLEKRNESNMKILKQVKEATEEIKITKLALEEALNSMEAAKREDVAVKEAVEKWGWGEHNRPVVECCPIGPKLVVHENDETTSSPVLKPTLSIGQILSRKLFLQEELMSGMMAEKGFLKRRVSLAQMLGKQNRDIPNCRKVERESSDQTQYNRKRKKSGFARFPLFLAKQTNNNQKRKKPTPNLK